MANIHMATQDPDVPEPGPANKCSCGTSSHWIEGYGLAGGGIGAYTYCDKCGDMVNKTQDHGYEDDGQE